MDNAYANYLKEELLPFSKASAQRTEEDINKILGITSNVEFFSKITEEKKSQFIHREACKYFRIQIFHRGETVVKFGEIGEEFYVILKGKVGVFVPSKVAKNKNRCTNEELKSMVTNSSIDYEDIADNEVRKSEATIKKMFEEQFRGQLNVLKRADSKLSLRFLREIGKIDEMKEVSALKEGNSFGELALISNRPRAATIICKELCIFASLGKQEFSRILSKEAQKILEEKAIYLQTLPLFSSMPKTSLIKLSYFFIEMPFTKNQIVYKVDDEVDNVYFVKSGEFKLAK